MKKSIRIIVTALIMSLALVFPWAIGNYDTNQTTALSKNLGVSVYAAEYGWEKSGNAWKYYESGAFVTGWLKSEGKWYYLGADGKMRTGWQKISGKWYHFGSDGKMHTGWLKSKGKWYYLKASGKMATKEWVNGGGAYSYYLKSNGQMARNETLIIQGFSSKFDNDGKSWWQC